MFKRVLECQNIILRLSQDNVDIKCIAWSNDKLIVGVTYGQEFAVEKQLDCLLRPYGLDFAVGWEITVARYPIMLVRDNKWVFKGETVCRNSMS